LIAERSGLRCRRQRAEAVGLLAAFAGVRLAADPVHGHASVVCASRLIEPKRHGAGRKRLTMLGGRLDLVERIGVAADSSAVLMRNSPRIVKRPLGVHLLGEFAVRSGRLPRTACCSVATASGVQI
jgi:hypothetical protein